MTKASRYFGISALVFLLFLSGVIVHPYFDYALEREQSAYHIWLDEVENQEGFVFDESFHLHIRFRVDDSAGSWEFSQLDSKGDAFRTILRALQLIEAGKLYQQQTKVEDDYLEVVLQSEEMSLSTKTPWSEVLRNMPAQNLLTMLKEVCGEK